MEHLTMVAFSDSVTNGSGRFGVSEGQTFRAVAGRQLGEKLQREVRVVNAGVDGDITPNAIRRVDSDVLAHRPQLVTVLFGVNDAGYYRPDTDGFAETPRVAEHEFANRLTDIVARLQSGGVKVLLLTPLPMNENYWGAQLAPYIENGLNFLVERYAARVREVARQRGVRLVDAYSHFRNLGDTTRIVPDGIHPNAEGHRLLAELLAPALVTAAQ